MFKIPKNRFTSRDSAASNDATSDASSNPASPVPSTASPASSAPTSPNIDSPKLSSSGLLGRTSSLMKSRLPSADSFTPSLLRSDSSTSAASSQAPQTPEADSTGGSGILSNPLGKLSSAAGNVTSSFSLPSIPTPKLSLPSSPVSLNTSNLLLPLSKLSLSDARNSVSSIDPFNMIETVMGTSASGAFGNVADLLSSVTGLTRVPGLRRYKRFKGRVGEVKDDISAQATERRKQLWKTVIVAANGLAIPDVIFKFPGRGKSFVLTPAKRSTIPLQWVHRGPGAIPNDLADKSCAELGMDALLQNLNDVLGTKYTFSDKPGLDDALQYCISKGWNFGYAYGMLRTVWKSDFTILIARWESLKEKDDTLRSDAVVGDTVRTPRLPPRRVWDLLSNRVLPFWAIADPDSVELDAEDIAEEEGEEEEDEEGEDKGTEQSKEKSTSGGGKKKPSNIPSRLWAVSHAWVMDEAQQLVDTIINDYEWPVPIPNDTSLEHVRIELLNMGAKYIWLDVLCLRQRCKVTAPDAGYVRTEELVEEKNGIRAEEVKLDIPAIGHIYQHDRYQTVITYFNGLGRPFLMGPTIIRGIRHWINRAWTLQETTPTWLPGGMTIALFDNTSYGEQVRPGLFEQVQRLCGVIALNPPDIFSVISAMQDRAFTEANDRVGAICYPLRLDTLPVYKIGEDTESAWRRLISHLTKKHRTDLLVLYPLRGDSQWSRWAPSWYQLMQLAPPHAPRIPYEEDEYLHPSKAEDGTVTYWHRGYVLEKIRLHLTARCEGILDLPNPDDPKNPHHIKMSTDHNQPIGMGDYFLVGVASMKHWVIGNLTGTREEDGEKVYEVEKISVIRVHNPDRTRLLEWTPAITKAKVYYN